MGMSSMRALINTQEFSYHLIHHASDEDIENIEEMMNTVEGRLDEINDAALERANIKLNLAFSYIDWIKSERALKQLKEDTDG